MQRVHLIAIGEATMFNLAIALSKRSNYLISGSYDTIEESALAILKKHKLLPDKAGWFPDNITRNLSAIVVGPDAKADNPELLRAKELGLKVYTMPEYLYIQTRNKTRIVISGSHRKCSVMRMILHVMKKQRIDTDYYFYRSNCSYENPVKLSYEARVAVLEGDEKQTSPIDSQPIFHQFKPHIAVITCIDKNSEHTYDDFDQYLNQFREFINLMEMQGRLIYHQNDKNIGLLVEKLRRDIVPFPYGVPKYEVVDGLTTIVSRKIRIPLQISGEDLLQDLNAARLACRQIGISEDQFNQQIADYQIQI